MHKLLIIEDDPNIQKLLAINFSAEHFQIAQAMDGQTGLESVFVFQPDIIILDINLPQLSGIEVCKNIKNNPQTHHIPIIMLTVRKDEIDRVLGFEIGADDYVAKPFSPRELVLRCRVALRQKKKQRAAPLIQVADIVCDEDRFEVTVGEQSVALTKREFNLLKYFLLHKECLLSRERLLQDVWGYHTEVDTRTVDAHIKTLRRKLSSKQAKIITVIGMGYKLTSKHP